MDVDEKNTDVTVDNETEQSQKIYDEKHVKEIIAERDKAKNRLREIEAEKVAQEEETLKEKGEFKSLSEKLKTELETAKKEIEKKTELESHINGMLATESEGIDQDLVDVIISNDSLSVVQKLEKVKKLKTALQSKSDSDAIEKPSTKTKPSISIGSDEYNKLSMFERAKIASVKR